MTEADHSCAVGRLLTGKCASTLDGVVDVGGWDERKRERHRDGGRTAMERPLSPLSRLSLPKRIVKLREMHVAIMNV